VTATTEVVGAPSAPSLSHSDSHLPRLATVVGANAAMPVLVPWPGDEEQEEGARRGQVPWLDGDEWGGGARWGQSQDRDERRGGASVGFNASESGGGGEHGGKQQRQGGGGLVTGPGAGKKKRKGGLGMDVWIRCSSCRVGQNHIYTPTCTAPKTGYSVASYAGLAGIIYIYIRYNIYI
jgi:hypothetical protein